MLENDHDRAWKANDGYLKTTMVVYDSQCVWNIKFQHFLGLRFIILFNLRVWYSFPTFCKFGSLF